jgi:hypothetical protein
MGRDSDSSARTRPGVHFFRQSAAHGVDHYVARHGPDYTRSVTYAEGLRYMQARYKILIINLVMMHLLPCFQAWRHHSEPSCSKPSPCIALSVAGRQ